MNTSRNKRLIETISDAAHQLDEVRGGARCVDDLFTPAANLQRARLRDASERLLLQTAPSPTAHAQTRKTEELLWRKVYYEVIATAKRIRKGNNSTSDWQTDELVLVHHHITAGLGFYHHLLWRLQCEFSLEMNGLLDCLVFFPDEGLKKGKSGGISNGVDKMAADEGTGRGGGGGEWANQMAHRCLIYLGDLCRYLVDVQPGWDYGLATHYYTQALLWKPDAGLPHNQLGTMAGSRNYSLDAVYHYMRCLCCAQTFEGTEGNLNQLIDKGVAQLIDNKGNNALARTVARLLCCARTWFCNRPPKLPMHKVCDDLLVDLRECLHAVEVVEPIEEPDDIEKFAMVKKINEKPTRMTEEIMFKSIAIVMMCLHNLDKKGSSELSRAVSLQLSMMAQVLHQIVLKVEAVLPPPPTPPPLLNGLANRRRRQRRRRKHRNSSDDDDCDNDLQSSDLSEGEEVVYVSGTDSDASEEKLIFDQNSSDSEDEVNGEVANGNEAVGSVQNGSKSQHYRDNLTFQHLHRLSQQGFILQTIKICFDWLSVNVETMKACGQTCKQFLDHAVTLFNHLLQVPFTFDSNNDENLTSNISDRITISENLSPLPLPEDVCLRDLPPLVSAQLGIDWQKGLQTNISSEEETYLRIYRLLAVGLRLAKVDDCACGWSFASRRRWFVVAKGATAVNGKQRPPRHNHNHNQRNHKSTTVVLVNKNNKKKNIYNGNADKRPAVTAAAPDNQENGDGRTKQHQQDAQKHDQLMANMGQLWLRAEVKELETKVRRSAQHQRLPPYLVLDADALTQHFALTKQLVVSKKFIVLIPSVVVSSLDEQKKESSGVRETIRWLEGQFRHGNRFVRAQRPNEHLPLPLIKYPKKKDREAWLFFQIVECCHFLSSQGGKSQGLVTLLTGSPTLLQSSNSNGFSPLGIASTAGISIEYIESFHSKWKSSSKSHG